MVLGDAQGTVDPYDTEMAHGAYNQEGTIHKQFSKAFTWFIFFILTSVVRSSSAHSDKPRAPRTFRRRHCWRGIFGTRAWRAKFLETGISR
jgi:hypothetical protein